MRGPATTAATFALALLVGGSLVLAARLWAPAPNVQVPLIGDARYAVPGTVAGLSAGDLAQPWRILVHFGADRTAALADPGDARYSTVWADVRAVLPDLTPPAGAATAQGAGACAALAAKAPGSVEVDLGQRLAWSSWTTIWGLGATVSAAGSSQPADRLLIAPDSTGAEACRYAGAAAQAYHAADVPALRHLASDLAALRNQPLDYDLTPLPPVSGLSVRPGIDVPDPGFARGAVAVRLENIAPTYMLAALFPPAASVRRSAGVDGLQNYSDGLAELHLGGDGTLQYAVGVPPSADTEGPGQALMSAAAFVDQAGGWPPTGLLFDLSAVPEPGSFRLRGGEGGSVGYSLTFTERWRGLPLLGDPASIAVDVGARGVLGYTRHVDVLAQEGAPEHFLPAAQALARLAASWPLAASSADRVVSDIFPAYAKSGEGLRWQPVWGVELDDGSIVALSAQDGSTLDVLRPQGAG